MFSIESTLVSRYQSIPRSFKRVADEREVNNMWTPLPPTSKNEWKLDGNSAEDTKKWQAWCELRLAR